MRWRKVGGILLVVVGCAGFGTIADDVRHKGELFGVAAILLAGLVLLVAGMHHVVTKGLALHWIAVGIGVGVVVGAAIDRMLTGVGGGAVLGGLVAAILSSRRQQTRPST